MTMFCPICEDKLVTVSAMTHGCCRCQQLWLMLNGKLQDGGPWPVAQDYDYIPGGGKARLVGAFVMFMLLGLIALISLVKSFLSVH